MTIQTTPKKKRVTRTSKTKTKSSPTHYKEIAEAAKQNAKIHGRSARTNTVYAAYVKHARAWVAGFQPEPSKTSKGV